MQAIISSFSFGFGSQRTCPTIWYEAKKSNDRLLMACPPSTDTLTTLALWAEQMLLATTSFHGKGLTATRGSDR